MSTPTEVHLDLALQIAEALARSGNVAAAKLIADSEARAVAALTTERDHLHAQLRALTLICGTNDANKFETWIDRANARAEVAEAVALAKWNGVLERALKAEAERDLLRAEVERCNDIINRASVQFFHDGTDGETAAKMLTVLNEAKP